MCAQIHTGQHPGRSTSSAVRTHAAQKNTTYLEGQNIQIKIVDCILDGQIDGEEAPHVRGECLILGRCGCYPLYLRSRHIDGYAQRLRCLRCADACAREHSVHRRSCVVAELRAHDLVVGCLKTDWVARACARVGEISYNTYSKEHRLRNAQTRESAVASTESNHQGLSVIGLEAYCSRKKNSIHKDTNGCALSRELTTEPLSQHSQRYKQHSQRYKHKCTSYTYTYTYT